MTMGLACDRDGNDLRFKSPPSAGTNIGHGHMRPRPDGAVAAVTLPAVLSPTLVPTSRLVIAFTGLAGSGKSTAAAHLVNAHGFARSRFAGPLKAMLAAFGLSPAEIDGDRKEFPSDLLCGRTPRWAMQSLGTEWGRELIGGDVWIRAWRASLPASNVVVDDCRFPNEAEAVYAVGGVLIHVERPGAPVVAGAHVSEQHELPAVLRLKNHGTLQEFLCHVSTAYRDLTWTRTLIRR